MSVFAFGRVGVEKLWYIFANINLWTFQHFVKQNANCTFRNLRDEGQEMRCNVLLIQDNSSAGKHRASGKKTVDGTAGKSASTTSDWWTLFTLIFWSSVIITTHLCISVTDKRVQLQYKSLLPLMYSRSSVFISLTQSFLSVTMFPCFQCTFEWY